MRWDELQVGQLIRFRAFPDVLRALRVEGGRVWLQAVKEPLTGSLAAWLDGRHESDGLAMPPDHEVEMILQPGDRVRMLETARMKQGEMMYVIRELGGSGLWDVAPFPDGRGGIYVRPHEVEMVRPYSPDYASAEMRMAAALGLSFTPGEDVHQKTADALGCSRAEAKMANFKALYGGTDDGR